MKDTDFIKGRAAIADALGKDEKTVSRWIAAGAITAQKGGPFPNSPLIVRRDEIERLQRRFQGGGE